jgi:hypothetical protein
MLTTILASLQPIIKEWHMFALMVFVYASMGATMVWAMNMLPKRAYMILLLGMTAFVGIANGWIFIGTNVLSGLIVGGVFAALFGFTLPFGISGATRRARAKYLLGHTNTQRAVTEFDRLKQPGTELITEASLQALLMSTDTTDGERQLISWLEDNIRVIGHKAGEYKRFYVSVDGVGEGMVEYFGISREDLARSQAQLVANSNGWLTTAPV